MAPEKETAVNQVTAALNGLDTAALKAMLLQFQQLSGDAQTMMGSVKSLTDALYNADAPLSDQNTVVGAAGALAAGAQSAQDGAASLRDGAAQLTAGAAQLSNGASSLSAGLTQLSGASKTVRDAIGQFRTGAGSLNDGAAQLQDGLDTYASQAIGKLTELAGSADTSALQDVLKALETRAQSYTSYTGSADGVRANVKFVMKTAGLPEEETTSSSDTEDSGGRTAGQNPGHLLLGPGQESLLLTCTEKARGTFHALQLGAKATLLRQAAYEQGLRPRSPRTARGYFK